MPVHRPTPKLWSKLESGSDVTSPQIGNGGSILGSPTYPVCKFGNGILSDVNKEGCTFPTGSNSINVDKGTIEFWAKVNYSPTDADYHHFFSCFDVLGGIGGVDCWFDSFFDQFRAGIMVGGTVQVKVYSGDFSWNSGDIIHFAVTWDRQGNDIGNSKTLVFKINNVEKGSSTTTWNTDTVNSNLYVGVDDFKSYHSDTVIDNLKTYNVCKTDFSDRFIEEVMAEMPMLV